MFGGYSCRGADDNDQCKVLWMGDGRIRNVENMHRKTTASDDVVCVARWERVIRDCWCPRSQLRTPGSISARSAGGTPC